jgi:hypothetical protein
MVGQFNSRNGPVKAKLFTCETTATIALEILSLCSYALRETIVPLPETVLKIVFRNTHSVTL